MRTILIILFCSMSYISFCQVITFNKRVQLGCNNTIFTSSEVTDSCFYITGIARDSINCGLGSLFVKYDILGNKVFHKILYDSLHPYKTWNPSLRTDYNGNLVVASHHSDSIGYTGGILKYTTNGELVYGKFYPNPYIHGILTRTDDMQMAHDSNYVIVNSASDSQGVSDVSILKLDSLGQKKWHITTGSPNYVDHSPCVYIENNNSYIIGYQQDNLSGVQMNYTVRSKLEKLDSAGNTIWTYESPNNQQIHGVNDLIKSKDGGWIVASAWGSERLGSSGTWSTPIQEAYVYKLDSFRNFLWGTKFHSDALTTANFTKIIELEDSSLIAFGTVVRVYPQPNPTYSIIHGRVVKLSPEGDSIWSRDYEYLSTANARHTIYDAERTHDGGFLICGEANGNDTINSNPVVFQQGWLLKLDEQGCLVPGCQLTSGILPLHATNKISLSLYPNPTSDYLNIYYYNQQTEENLTFSIVDMQGRILKSYTTSDISDKTYLLPVYDLVAGAYILEVRQDGKIVGSEQFVKQ